MIRLDMPQGSPEWTAARLAVATASRFDEILTNKTAKFSASSTRYAWELIAEEILGYPVEEASSQFMARGTILEKKAVAYYELRKDCDTEAVGFLLRDDGRVGCSPDRLVGTDGLLEIKVPSAVNHLGYMIGDEEIRLKYRAQVQGQLLIAERAWCDTLSYNPDLGSIIVRTVRDEEYIEKLSAGLTQFLQYVDDCKDKLVRAGHFPDLAVPALKLA